MNLQKLKWEDDSDQINSQFNPLPLRAHSQTSTAFASAAVFLCLEDQNRPSESTSYVLTDKLNIGHLFVLPYCTNKDSDMSVTCSPLG